MKGIKAIQRNENTEKNKKHPHRGQPPSRKGIKGIMGFGSRQRIKGITRTRSIKGIRRLERITTITRITLPGKDRTE